MSHVTNVVNALHLEDVRLVIGEVGVGLDVFRHLLQRKAVFQLNIHHTAMNAFAQGDGHRQRILHTLLAANTNAVAHRHTRTEVGIAQALGGQTLHQGAYNAVAARIPTGGNDADGVGLLVQGHQAFTIATDIGMNVERVDGIDAQRQYLLGILLATAGRSSEDSDVDILQFSDVLHHLVVGQFSGFVCCSVSTHHTGNLEVGSGFQSLNTVLSNVAVTHYGCSDLFHLSLSFMLVKYFFRLQKYAFSLKYITK